MQKEKQGVSVQKQLIASELFRELVFVGRVLEDTAWDGGVDGRTAFLCPGEPSHPEGHFASKLPSTQRNFHHVQSVENRPEEFALIVGPDVQRSYEKVEFRAGVRSARPIFERGER